MCTLKSVAMTLAGLRRSLAKGASHPSQRLPVDSVELTGAEQGEAGYAYEYMYDRLSITYFKDRSRELIVHVSNRNGRTFTLMNH